MLQDIKDYFTSLTFEQKRNGLVAIIILAILIAPIAISVNYNNRANANYANAKINYQNGQDLKTAASKKQKAAVVKQKNAAQTQKLLEDNTNKLIKSQMTLMDYANGNKLVTKDAMETAKKTTSNLISSNDILGDPNDHLIVYSSTSKNLKITASYDSHYSVFQTNINVVLHYIYNNKVVYIVSCVYDLNSNTFTSFDPYSTQDTYLWNSGHSQKEDAKKAEEKRKAQEEKAKKEKEAEAKKKSQHKQPQKSEKKAGKK